MLINLSSFASINEDTDFQINFNIAKQHLSQRRVNKALPYLLHLQKNYPENANLKYLVGVCYVEAEIVNPKTIILLSEASLKASLEYDPNSMAETRVPIYVFYYLSVAYAQSHKCEEAEKSRADFMEIYPHEDQFYIDESLKWVEKCKGMSAEPERKALPRFPEFKPYRSKEEFSTKEALIDTQQENKPITEQVKKEKVIKTKRVEYSTNAPLYGVQLGAFKEVIPVSRFKDAKNLDAFVDKQGLIRYVIGNFSIHSQAESLLEVLRKKGYQDAFIVDINNAKRFKDEVISVDNVNIRASVSSRIEYRVQLGAFKERIPYRTAFVYLQIEGIKELRDEDFTYITVGKFKTYAEAKAYEQAVIDMGIKDAFVIALTNGRKISLEQANEFNLK